MKKKEEKPVLRSLSYEDVSNLYEFCAEFCTEFDGLDILAEAAELIGCALETRDLKLIRKARQLCIYFFLQLSTDDEFMVWMQKGIVRDDNLDYLFN